VIHEQVRRRLAERSRAHPQRLIFVDSRTQLGQFSFGVLKGNESEIVRAAGGAKHPEQAAISLAGRTGRPVFCTIGERGTLVARPSGEAALVAGCPVSGPVDIVGAGDSATSGIVLALLAGADEFEAAAIGNLVASVTVQQLGTTGTASPEQVIARWHEVQTIKGS
jgi:sugar/nucleoside kinase (ribokinase family)